MLWASRWLRRPERRLLFTKTSSNAACSKRSASNISAILTGLRRTSKVEKKDQALWKLPAHVNERECRAANKHQVSNEPPQVRVMRARDALKNAKTPAESRKALKKFDHQLEERLVTSEKMTRRKRFHDLGHRFGKKSLVYQFKYGELKDHVASLNLEMPGLHPPEPQPRTGAKASAQSPSSKGSQPSSRISQPSQELHFTVDSQGLNGQHSSEPPSLPRSESPWTWLETHELQGPNVFKKEMKKRLKTKDREQEHEKLPQVQVEEMNPDPVVSETVYKNSESLGIQPSFTTIDSHFIYGRSAVKAALTCGKRNMYKLYVHDGSSRRHEGDDVIIELAKKHNIRTIMVRAADRALLDNMSSGRAHNGVVLEASSLPMRHVRSLGELVEEPGKLGFRLELCEQKRDGMIGSADPFVARASAISPKPLVFVLSNVLDPVNLGAMLRIAGFFGVDCVCIPKQRSASVTPVALKVASGAAEELEILSIDSPEAFVLDSQLAGWKVYAAVSQPFKKAARQAQKIIGVDTIIRQDPLQRDPCILVFGNEGEGLSNSIKASANYQLTISQMVKSPHLDSLNVGVAAGILCHAFLQGSAAARAARDELQSTLMGGLPLPKGSQQRPEHEDLMFELNPDEADNEKPSAECDDHTRSIRHSSV